MRVSPTRRKNDLGDVWCRRCGHASRFGQWVPQNDHCPFCAGPGTDRLPWMLLRLRFPHLPLRPEIGQVYRPRAAK